jgi:hypothetical protein
MRRAAPWLWLYCRNPVCLHRAPMAVTPLSIRLGTGASSDRLRLSERCQKCGRRGAISAFIVSKQRHCPRLSTASGGLAEEPLSERQGDDPSTPSIQNARCKTGPQRCLARVENRSHRDLSRSEESGRRGNHRALALRSRPYGGRTAWPRAFRSREETREGIRDLPHTAFSRYADEYD